MKIPFRWRKPVRSPVSEKHPSDVQTQPHIQPQAPSQKSQPLNAVFSYSGTGQPRWSQTDYASMARLGYMQNPVAHRCIRLLSQAISNSKLVLYDGNAEIDGHPMLGLMQKPNEQQGSNGFLEALVGHLLVSGNAYIEMASVENAPRALHLLRPDRMKVLTDLDGWANGFEYTTGWSRKRHMVNEDGQCAILHVTLFHPLDDLYGMPPLLPAMMALDVHHAASTWNKALLDNSARPSGALVYASGTDSNMTDEQFDRLKQELEDGYSGATRAGRPLLLEGGLDWKAMGYSPRDMDFVEARNAAARDIALAFGVPPMVLGIPGDNTYSNYQEANRAFIRQTLLPLTNRILDAFNNWLQPRFGADLRLAIDEDRIEGLAGEREAVWQRLKDADFLTDAEKRQALGYSPEPLPQDQ